METVEEQTGVYLDEVDKTIIAAMSVQQRSEWESL